MNWKKVSLALFGVILLMGAIQLGNTYATTIQGYEQQIEDSYNIGLNEGFAIGKEVQYNFTTNNIIQALQSQGWYDHPVVAGNESGVIRLWNQQGLANTILQLKQDGLI